MIRRLAGIALRLALLAGFVWAVLVAALFLHRHERIYPFAQGFRAEAPEGLPRGRLLRLEGRDGVPIFVWASAPMAGAPMVLHFTGNGAYLPGAARHVTPLVIRGYGAAMPVYRGAGGSPGEPTEEVLIADALTLYDALAEAFPDAAQPPVIWGTSLGAAVATAVAVERPAAGLILEVPFAELCTVAQHHYPWLPACLILPDERWENLRRIAEVNAPILTLGAEADTVIPVAEAVRLHAAAPEPKQLVLYPGAGHGGVMAAGAMDDILPFLAEHAPP
ncbi:MAG: alpha/beta hydrolase [Pseudomonadota bacterium]